MKLACADIRREVRVETRCMYRARVDRRVERVRECQSAYELELVAYSAIEAVDGVVARARRIGDAGGEKVVLHLAGVDLVRPAAAIECIHIGAYQRIVARAAGDVQIARGMQAVE